MTGKPKPLIVVLGPTAVGKTGLALELAQRLDGEIIGADSRQIYRYMDIGTAKPTPEQQQLVPHHLIDVVDPDQNLGLAQYQRMAYDAVEEIHRRGRLPLLVGGTGQYITAVVQGWLIPEVPPNDALRSELEVFAAEHGSEALHHRLQQVDATTAAAVHHRNVRRVVRALEVFLETGAPISELQRKHPPPYAIMQVGLTMPRDRLYERADRRLAQMIEAGFLEEVRDLLNRGYDRKLPAMSGLGYAQLAACLQGEITLEDAVDMTRMATHDFIRRQLTWFRGHDAGIQWVDAGQIDMDSVIASVMQWWETISCAS